MKNIPILIFIFLSSQLYGQSPIERFNHAKEQYDAGKYETAIRSLKALEAELGANPKIQSLLVYAYEANKDYVNAQIELDKYKKLSPRSFSDAHKAVLDKQEAITEGVENAEENFKETIEAERIKKAERIITNTYDTPERKAVLAKQEKSKQIVKEKQAESRAREDKLYTLLEKGVKSYDNGNNAEAFKFFSQASDLVPTDTTASLYAGMTAQKLGKEIEAEKFYKRYIAEGYSELPFVFLQLSNVSKSEGDYQQRVAWLKEGINKTQNMDLRMELANTYVENDAIDLAIKELELAVSKGYKSDDALAMLGACYEQIGNNEKKMYYLLEAIKLNPLHYTANYNLGVAVYNQGTEYVSQVQKMNSEQYRKEGRAKEDKACEYFAQAKKYFSASAQSNDNPEVLEILSTIKAVLEQCNK